MEPKTLQGIWPVGGPWTLQPVSQGENNLTWKVAAPAGAFVLRAYRGDRPEAHVRYELAVLDALRARALPFQVPVPIATATGELLAEVSGEWLTLAPWLPGSPPPGDDLALAETCGRALAELVATLAELRIDPDPRAAPYSMSHDFEGWAGAAIDPAQTFRGLPLTTTELAQVTALMGRRPRGPRALS
jgi:homoserine kinase type II